MKNNIFFGAVAASLIMTSCSQDEPMQVAGTDEIRFSVATESQSRAAESFCANWLPGSFNIWAKTNPGSELYIPGDVVTNQGGSSYGFAGDNVRFWPKEGNLDFLAFSGDDETFNHDLNAPKFVDFKVNDDPTKQRDLIYAVRTNVAKGTTGTVGLNFRHALSQVVFKVKVSNPNLKLVVSNVKIGGLSNQGTYSLPAAETTENYLDPNHGDAADDISKLPAQGVGEWSALSGKQAYTVSAAYWVDGLTHRETVTINSGETRVISSTNKDHLSTDYVNDGQTVIGNPWGKVLNLIPQQQQAWIPGGVTGSYIALECEIFTTEGGREKQLTEKSWTYVPVAVNWQQGVRYVYTLDFGNGGAGWTDGPDGPNPQPTLGNISVNCESVDDFAMLSGEMKTYSITFIEGGDNPTPGLGVQTVETSRNSASITIPDVIPAFDFKHVYEACGTAYEQIQDKPQFRWWTRSTSRCKGLVDVFIDWDTKQSGRFYPGSVTLPTKYGETSLELIPVWGYNMSTDFDLHEDDFGGVKDNSRIATRRVLIEGDPYDGGMEKPSPHYHGAERAVLPEGYELVGYSYEYDEATRNIGITPDLPLARPLTNLRDGDTSVKVPFTKYQATATGVFFLKLHSVYRKIETE